MNGNTTCITVFIYIVLALVPDLAPKIVLGSTLHSYIELNDFVFYCNLIKYLPLMFRKFFSIAIYCRGRPTKKYFIGEMVLVTALGTKHFVLSY